MDYYTVKDVMERTGTSKSYSYKLITILLEEFKKEYPESIIIKGKVPKWYFDKKLNTKGEI